MPTMRTGRLAAAALITALGLSTLALLGPASPSAALDPGFVSEVSRSFQDDNGGTLPECGPRNINGRGNTAGLNNAATWSVQSTLANGATVEVGDEWQIRGTVISLGANNGNNGPDPLVLMLPISGQAIPVGFVGEADFGPGEVFNEGGGFTGSVGQYNQIAWEFDVNSNPGIGTVGDGAQVRFTMTVRAVAPGVVTLPRMDVFGHDETPIAGNFDCEFPVGFSWTVEAPPVPPTSGPDNATTDASYSLLGMGGTTDDAAGGAHAIDIDVLANDDDPEVPGGVGSPAQVRIFDWQPLSVQGGTVSCGTPQQKGLESFVNMSVGPCRYTPPQDVIGQDSFGYVLRSVTGLTRFVVVNVQLRPNPAPFVSQAQFAASSAAVDQVFDLGDVISDFAGDTEFFCTPAGGPVTFEPNVGSGTVSGDCQLTFTAVNTPVQQQGTFEYRVCDVHPLLTDFGPIAEAVAGYDQGSPDDLTATTNSRCRDASASVLVTPAASNLVAPPIAGPDSDVVDANYADTSEFSLRIPVVDNDFDITDPEFPDEIGGLDLLPGSLDPADGTATFDIDEGTDTYEMVFTPAEGVEGEVTFQYRICDDPEVQNPPIVDPNPDDQFPNLGTCGLGTVTIFVVPNDPPSTEPDEVLTSSIAPVTDFDAGVNDTDPQGDTIECTPGNLPAEPVGLVASATIDAACLVDIVPVVGAAGIAQLTYEACDVHALADPDDPETPYGTAGETTDDVTSRCSTEVVSATIVTPEAGDPGLFEVDPDPICVADAATTTAGAAVEVAVLTNDSDLDLTNAASPLAVTSAGIDQQEDVTANGGVVVATADGLRVRYTPPAGFTGTDTFSYGAQDTAGQGCAATVTVTVNGVAGTGATQPTGGTLARTGGVPGGFGQIQIGLGLALLGLGFVLLGTGHRPGSRRTAA
jgi:hypothetical protein